MTPQPQSQNSASDSSHRTSASRASAHGDHSWAEDGRPTRRFQAAPVTPLPISETAVSQADGEA